MIFLKINDVVEKLLGWVIPDGYEGPCLFTYVIIFAYASIYSHVILVVGFGFLFLISILDLIADIIKKDQRKDKKIKGC